MSSSTCAPLWATGGQPVALSVVIPAYNEERRLGRTLAAICQYLRPLPITWEAIVVDDGSTDGTARLVETAARFEPRVRLIRLPANRGKGHAVRVGVGASCGRQVLFSDADLATPIEELARLAAAIDAGASAAIGSRAGPAHAGARRPKVRALLGWVGGYLVRAVAVPDISDTQCGFKLFDGDKARLAFGLAEIDGWGFDVEILYLFARFGWPVAEVPVRWTHQPGSKLRPSAYLKVLTELVQLRRIHAFSEGEVYGSGHRGHARSAA